MIPIQLVKSITPRLIGLTLLTIVSVGLFLCVPTVSLANEAEFNQIYSLIRQGEFNQADSNLKQVGSNVEETFLRGYIAFERENYNQARKNFNDVVDKTDTTSIRRKDALYYLDRLKLYSSPSASAPMINVRVHNKKERISGRSAVVVSADDTEDSSLIITDGSWTVTVSKGKLVISGKTPSGNVRNSLGRTQVMRPAKSNQTVTIEGISYRGKLRLVINNGSIDVVNRLPLDKYLNGVVKKELAEGWPMPVVKAQAVASRSFAIHRIINNQKKGYDLSATSLSQVYGGEEAETPRITKAVNETQGEVLTFNGRVVPGYFHANSGGYIESPTDVWGGQNRSFIKPKEDRWSLNAKYNSWSTRISRNRVNQKLRENGHPTLNSGRASFHVAQKLPSGRAKTIQYASSRGTITINANDFRVSVGSEKLKSSWFENIRTTNSSLHFQGKGWGHGVGMSQWGARVMAEDGKTYKEILNYYYEPSKIAGQYGPTYLTSASTDR